MVKMKLLLRSVDEDHLREVFTKLNIAEPYASQIAKVVSCHDDLVEALKALLDRDMRNTCQHESTHRGGNIWEICDDCGAKWADDTGGKPDWEDPAEWQAAEALLKRLL